MSCFNIYLQQQGFFFKIVPYKKRNHLFHNEPVVRTIRHLIDYDSRKADLKTALKVLVTNLRVCKKGFRESRLCSSWSYWRSMRINICLTILCKACSVWINCGWCFSGRPWKYPQRRDGKRWVKVLQKSRKYFSCQGLHFVPTRNRRTKKMQ